MTHYLRRSTTSGATTVETSLVVLLMMFLIAGVVDFGMVMARYSNLVHAVQEAAIASSSANVPCAWSIGNGGIAPVTNNDAAIEGFAETTANDSLGSTGVRPTNVDWFFRYDPPGGAILSPSLRLDANWQVGCLFCFMFPDINIQILDRVVLEACT